EASQSVRAAMTDLGEEAGDPKVPGEESFSSMTVRVTGQGDEILREIRERAPDSESDAEPGDDEGVAPPPELMELRPSALGELRAGLLSVGQPGTTAVVRACVEDPGGPARRYRAAIQLAAGRRPAATDGPASDAFTSYDAKALLDEFFPGAE